MLSGAKDIKGKESNKWAVKLRATKTDGNPLILMTNMEAWHGGASGRIRRPRKTAYRHAFLLDFAGIRE